MYQERERAQPRWGMSNGVRASLRSERREQRCGTILLPRNGHFVAFRLANPETLDARRRVAGLIPFWAELRAAPAGTQRLPMRS